jgi:hypothetical protein
MRGRRDPVFGYRLEATRAVATTEAGEFAVPLGEITQDEQTKALTIHFDPLSSQAKKSPWLSSHTATLVLKAFTYLGLRHIQSVLRLNLRLWDMPDSTFTPQMVIDGIKRVLEKPSEVGLDTRKPA